MMVGIILERDGLPLRNDTVCQAAEACAMAASSVASSRRTIVNNSKNIPSEGVKSSPFYFGSANSVIERDEKSSKF
jgi:hypothetical protein